MMKIININEENLHIFQVLQEYRLMIILKVTKKQCSNLSVENTILEKPQGKFLGLKDLLICWFLYNLFISIVNYLINTKQKQLLILHFSCSSGFLGENDWKFYHTWIKLCRPLKNLCCVVFINIWRTAELYLPLKKPFLPLESDIYHSY